LSNNPRPQSAQNAEVHARAAAYWRTNLTYLGGLLAVWALVSYGFGIVFADALNRFTIPGTSFPAGFWFAQQGAIYVFVVLIFVYVVLMNRLDQRYGLAETDDEGPAPHGSAAEESAS
jgi:putative solute:sodium symporter small subunit